LYSPQKIIYTGPSESNHYNFLILNGYHLQNPNFDASPEFQNLAGNIILVIAKNIWWRIETASGALNHF